MKLTIPQPDLLAAIAYASRLCPSRPLVPITGAVLLAATDAGLRIRATDLDHFADVTAPAHVADTGRAAVSGRLLAAIAKLCRGDVELIAESGLQVRVNGGSWTLPLLHDEDFPATPPAGTPLGTVDGDTLARALSRTGPLAARAHESVTNLHAVHLHTGPQLTIEATDRYQAAFTDIDWSPTCDPADLHLTASAVPHLTDLAKTATDVTLSTTDSTLTATTGSQSLTARHAGEPMPNLATYDRPASDYPLEVHVQTRQLRDALAAVQLVLDRHDPVRLLITPEQIRLTAPLADATAAEHQLPVLQHRGDDPEFVIGLASARLTEALTMCGTPEIAIACRAPTRPILIRSVNTGEPDNRYRHVLMPQRLVTAAS